MAYNSKKIKTEFGSFIKQYRRKSQKPSEPIEWPFSDPENVAVFTSTHIVNRMKPILHATHDEEDGAWQFHSGETTSMEDALIVSLKEIFIMDPSIGLLADLPLGYVAERRNREDKWIVKRKE